MIKALETWPELERRCSVFDQLIILTVWVGVTSGSVSDTCSVINSRCSGIYRCFWQGFHYSGLRASSYVAPSYDNAYSQEKNTDQPNTTKVCGRSRNKWLCWFIFSPTLNCRRSTCPKVVVLKIMAEVSPRDSIIAASDRLSLTSFFGINQVDVQITQGNTRWSPVRPVQTTCMGAATALDIHRLQEKQA